VANPSSGPEYGSLRSAVTTLPGEWRAKRMGGLLNSGTGNAWLKSVTIAANSASIQYRDHVGGVYGRGNVYVANTIMAGNPVGADEASDRLGRSNARFGNPHDCGGQVVTLGGNLVGNPRFPASKADGTLEHPCDLAPWTPWPSG
jgi:hypothetical protein